MSVGVMNSSSGDYNWPDQISLNKTKNYILFYSCASKVSTIFLELKNQNIRLRVNVLSN